MTSNNLEWSPKDAPFIPIEPVGPNNESSQMLRPTNLYPDGPLIPQLRLEILRPITVDPHPKILTPEQIFEQEKNSFIQWKKRLLNDPSYLNKYVAVVGGKVVDSDFDDGILVERVDKRFGYIPIYIGKIRPEGEKEYEELPSPEEE